MITDNYETQPNHFFAAISGRQLLPTWYLKLFIDLQLQPFFYYQQLALRNSTKQSYLKHPLSLRPRLIHSLLKPHFRGSVGGNVSIKQGIDFGTHPDFWYLPIWRYQNASAKRVIRLHINRHIAVLMTFKIVWNTECNPARTVYCISCWWLWSRLFIQSQSKNFCAKNDKFSTDIANVNYQTSLNSLDVMEGFSQMYDQVFAILILISPCEIKI